VVVVNHDGFTKTEAQAVSRGLDLAVTGAGAGALPGLLAMAGLGGLFDRASANTSPRSQTDGILWTTTGFDPR
jgi:hypothetical protein